jgi:chromosome segregation ATPase
VLAPCSATTAETSCARILSQVTELQSKKTALEDKIKQTEAMIGHGLDWKDAQTFLEKYREEIRVVDNQIAKVQLGEDALTELRAKKQELETKLKGLDGLKASGDISNKVYKEKKKDIEREIQTVEKDIVESM